MTERSTILVLADEITRAGLPPRARALIEALHRVAEIVLVARCYLTADHRARRRLPNHELYGFDSKDYNARVRAFATDLMTTHRPSWALCNGWTNPRLAADLDRLKLPIVCYVDSPPPDLASEDQLHAIFRCSDAIVFRDSSIAAALTNARHILHARSHQTIASSTSDVGGRHATAGRRWISRLLNMVDAHQTAAADLVAGALYDVGTRTAAMAEVARAAEERDARTIRSAGVFNATLFSPDPDESEDDALTDYLHASRRAVRRDRPLAGRLLRRPLEGFNPLLYVTTAPNFEDARGEDPLAHFVRAGCPDGPWRHEVLRPDYDVGSGSNGRAAIHAHFHYPDLLSGLIDRIQSNRSTADLFVTVTSDESLLEMAGVLERAGVEAQVRVCENRGRDLWPFLDLLQSGAFDGYAVIGHLHGKRSPSYVKGDRWRDFLWTHLIGGDPRIMDVILDRFATDDTLGLVFAEDPHLDGWEANLALASDLAGRAGIALPLPNHFDYPMGSMFWARPAALAPLRALGLTRDMMPDEPVPEDGTILHAIERLIPFFVAKAGFRYATTYVPGSTR